MWKSFERKIAAVRVRNALAGSGQRLLLLFSRMAENLEIRFESDVNQHTLCVCHKKRTKTTTTDYLLIDLNYTLEP